VSERGCSCWLELVVCVILYKDESLYNGMKCDCPYSNYKFLLVKRDNGKWAIPGGIGGSEVTNNLFSFAAVEVLYDTDFYLIPSELEQFKTIISSCGKNITIFFSCKLGRYNEDLKGKLFSFKEIQNMDKNGEIAFDNAQIIAEFIEKQ